MRRSKKKKKLKIVENRICRVKAHLYTFLVRVLMHKYMKYKHCCHKFLDPTNNQRWKKNEYCMHSIFICCFLLQLRFPILCAKEQWLFYYTTIIYNNQTCPFIDSKTPAIFIVNIVPNLFTVVIAHDTYVHTHSILSFIRTLWRVKH